MEMPEHVILTRFSVRFTADQPPQQDEWLAYRLSFFTEATLASIRAQSMLPTAWLVFLDDQAPDWLRDEMSALAEDNRFLVPVYVPGPFTPASARDAIAGLPLTAGHLVTTRLDSDDALGIRFVEKVGAHAREQLAAGLSPDGLYLNATRGLQLDRRGMVFQLDYSSNAFISYLERRDPGTPPRTVLQDGRHANARDHAPVLAFQDEPLWLQIVHGSNLANSITGRRVANSRLPRSFAIELPYGADVGTMTLARQTLAEDARRLRRWVSEPWLIKEYMAGRVERLGGTRVRPRR